MCCQELSKDGPVLQWSKGPLHFVGQSQKEQGRGSEPKRPRARKKMVWPEYVSEKSFKWQAKAKPAEPEAAEETSNKPAGQWLCSTY